MYQLDIYIMLEHDINVQNAEPIKQHPYRANLIKRSLMKQEAEYLLWFS